VEKFVDYFPERPEESSNLYLVNLIPVLISDATLYLSIDQRRANSSSSTPAPHFLMRVKFAAFHNPS
jgi:hypothetical protein